jgi:thioredoxin-like negative regulator of GroEL
MNTLTEQNWPEVITASPLPVFVIYHSPFSAYSRRSLALLLKLEPQFPTVRFTSVDVDTQDNLARLHGIVAIPAFVVYRSGVKRAFFMGERSEKRLVENIAKAAGL